MLIQQQKTKLVISFIKAINNNNNEISNIYSNTNIILNSELNINNALNEAPNSNELNINENNLY